MRALFFSRNNADLDLPETAFFQELVQLNFAKPKPVVCIKFAGLLEPMAREIENDQAAAALQNSMSRINSALGVNRVMQRLAQNRKIDAVFCNRRVLNIAEPVFEIIKSMFLRQL